MADRARRDAGQRPESSGAQGTEHSAHRPAGPIGTLVDQDAGHRGRRRLLHDAAGQRGAMLRAYDKATGKEVGAVYMPAPQTGSPMTYSVEGRQYIVVAIGGGHTAANWWRTGCRTTRAQASSERQKGAAHVARPFFYSALIS